MLGGYRDLLVRLVGPRALLVHGDPMVVSRWRWLRKRLPHEAVDLVDAGCGNGWLCINASSLGHRCLGLTFNEDAVDQARRRAESLRSSARFEAQDLRDLSARADLRTGRFSVVISTETIEHILDDRSVMVSMAQMMRPGGRLLLTTPNADYRPIDRYDAGPYLPVEDGGHVRKGYSASDLRTLCDGVGLELAEVSGCSGFLAQKLTGLIRALSVRIPYPIVWSATLPLRLLPALVDPVIRRAGWPDYSICVVAVKRE